MRVRGACWERGATSLGSVEQAVSEGKQHGEAWRSQRVWGTEGLRHGEAWSSQGERCSIMGMQGAARERGAATGGCGGLPGSVGV